MPHLDTETFTCAYSQCAKEVEQFPFLTRHDEKTCSAFCRKKREQERREAIANREAMAEQTDADGAA